MNLVPPGNRAEPQCFSPELRDLSTEWLLLWVAQQIQRDFSASSSGLLSLTFLHLSSVLFIIFFHMCLGVCVFMCVSTCVHAGASVLRSKVDTGDLPQLSFHFTL